MQRIRGRHARVPWWQREAVRVRGYAVVVAIVGLLVAREYISGTDAEYILLAVGSALGIWGIETSRARTVSNSVVRDEVAPVIAARVAGKQQRPEEAADDTLRWLKETK